MINYFTIEEITNIKSQAPPSLSQLKLYRISRHTHTRTHCHISFKMASRVLLAAEQGDRKSMQAFITDKEVNIVNEEGCTPLMVAAANGRDEIIRQLLEQEVSVLTGVLKFGL